MDSVAKARSYSNGSRLVHVTESNHWWLLDTETVNQDWLTKHLVGIRIERTLPLLRDRLAIQVSDDSVVNVASALQDLVKAGHIRKFWPAYERFGGVGFFDDNITIRLSMSPDPEELISAGLNIIGPTRLPGVWHARATRGNALAVATAAQLITGVDWAEPDLIRHVSTHEIPNDPEFRAQWHLESSNDRGDINVSAAWDITFGNPDIVIAIFDNGFDMDHPDLAPNIVGGFDAVDGDDQPDAPCIESFDGAGPSGACPVNRPYRASHGTAVAGVSAARADNRLFGAGVCPMCGLYPVRILSGGGMRSVSTAQAFHRAAEAGASVINNSWGPAITRYFPLSQAEREVFNRITTTGRNGLGVVIVFAAGNDFFTPATANPYASHPEVVTVSASTRLDDFACYSNYGRVISVSAPSRGCNGREPGLETTDVAGQEGYSADDFTRDFGGTSAASPVVAGLAGLILSANPDLTAQQVRLILQSTAEKIRADQNNWVDMVGIDLMEAFAYDKHGFSPGFGYGRIDAHRAVSMAVNNPPKTGASCHKDCGACIDDRCAPACRDDLDCPSSSQCQAITGGGKACLIVPPALTLPGQPCTTECEICVDTADTSIRSTSICTEYCDTDSDCLFGFDCRTLNAEGRKACVPGNKECGAPWGSVRCQSDVVVEGNGETFCACDCIPGSEAACPDGFKCENVVCSQRRGTISCEIAPNLISANYPPQCVPDPNVQRPCSVHQDCSSGLFCIEGVCAPDRAPGGCDICTACDRDNDCNDGEGCIETRRGRRCLKACSFGLPDQCPGDTACANLPGPPEYFCVNPDFDRKGICPRAWRCELDGRCLADEDCDDSSPCIHQLCGGDMVDASVEAIIDAGPDGSQEEVDAALPMSDVGQGIVVFGERNVRSDGCGSMSSGATPGWLALLILLAWPVSRRRLT
jgi:subtilisin family serine protease